jgi:eukaryotic-like serine/threonine-protein kinase
MGSPLYMAPEQMQSSKNVDSRGDIWALGIILYELITGETPFEGETMPELVLQIMSAAPAPLRNKRPDAPDGLERVVFKCLEKHRGNRYQTVGELAVALLPFAPKRAKASVERIAGVLQSAGLSSSSLEVPRSSQAPSANKATAANWGRTADTAGGGRKAFGVGVLAVISVTAIGFAVLGRSRSPEAPVPPGFATANQAPPVVTTEAVASPPTASVVGTTDTAASAPSAVPVAEPVNSTPKRAARHGVTSASKENEAAAITAAAAAETMKAVAAPAAAVTAAPTVAPGHPVAAPASTPAPSSTHRAPGAYDDRK